MIVRIVADDVSVRRSYSNAAVAERLHRYSINSVDDARSSIDGKPNCNVNSGHPRN